MTRRFRVFVDETRRNENDYKSDVHNACHFCLFWVKSVCFELKKYQQCCRFLSLFWVRPPPGCRHAAHQIPHNNNTPAAAASHSPVPHIFVRRTMAATPINGLGGRKRRDDLWTYFQYNPSERKTECIVLGDDGKCGHKLGGKNTTNLKRHLKAHHADIFSKVS